LFQLKNGAASWFPDIDTVNYFADSLRSALGLIINMDPEIMLIAATSLQVAGVGVFFSSITGAPLGLLISLNQFRGKGVVLLALNTLMALPTVVVGLVFYGLLSRNGALGHWGLLFTPSGVSLGLAFLSLPIVTNLTISAINGLDPRLGPTCKSLGATGLQTSVMMMKEARHGVMAAIIVAFGRVISEVGIAMMLGGNIKGLTRTMTTAIALETSKGEFELGLALGLILLSVALLVNLAMFILQRNKP
jgi:tungstate transport system permease protein